MRELVERNAESAVDLFGQAERSQQAGQHHAVVDADRELVEADRPQQVVDHQRRFDIGGDGKGADGVEIALHEFAVAAALRVLAAPHGGDVVALERRAQLADVLGGEARQRHRQVEPHAHLTAAVVLEAVELLVGFLAPFAGEDFQIFQGRRVDGAEAVRAIDPSGRVDQPLARDHRLRQVIAKAFERAGSDHRKVQNEEYRVQNADCRLRASERPCQEAP